MNWFTQSHVETASLEKKKKLLEEWGGCDHVNEDPSKIVVVSYENDSFGREGYCICAECLEKSEQKELEEEHCCHDCKQSFPLKDGVLWKEWNFDPRDGSEPIFICNSCRTKEAHITRVRNDKADYEAEVEWMEWMKDRCL